MKKIAIDAYYNNGICHVVGGIFENWTDEHVLKFIYADVKVDSDYIPGEFYKREMPGILKLLEQVDLNEFDYIIVDGYVYLKNTDGSSKDGLGMRLSRALGEKYPSSKFQVVGIAKSLYGEDKEAYCRCFRGKSKNPLYITTSTERILSLEQDDPTLQDMITFIFCMSGDNRIPTIIKEVDSETKKYWK